ncbi:carboxypeptidase B [Aedes aegypti]|uniref:Carboxypeptidase B1 n=1 Tax=Aedes aegypti TaxID=7159 RepID=CBPB1_AEDAE|nr:carboxypeptidase B [Aedes aegypti]A0A1S4F020.1 RecName: Full=Carboxypeptidase B1; Short=AaCPB-I; Short=CPBAe1; Flags: Precursor [Aedes aegypti]
MIPRIVVVLLSVLAVVTARRSYEGYKVYGIVPESPDEAEILYQIRQSNPDLDFWHLTKQPGDEARVLVAPKDQRSFLIKLIRHGLHYQEVISDVEGTLAPYNEPRTRGMSLDRDVSTSYLRHNEINEYLQTLSQKYPSLVSVEEAGTSYEGRSIKTITINKKPGNAVVFLDAGIHAREWIAPATALYAIEQLVEHSSENQEVLSNLTWVIMPVVNPDGYEFSHETDRFWRKTRKPTGKTCKGTDGNRNFDYHWGEVGASTQACADTFRGETAFSEPETRAVRDAVMKLKGSCKFYLSLHSYGNYILYPWGWTSKLPETWEAIDEVAQAGAEAIKQSTGSRYTVGSSTNVLYAAAGGSDDWAFAVAEVPISITMELPGGGNGGFNPPPSSIEKIVNESWVGIKAMALKVAQMF